MKITNEGVNPSDFSNHPVGGSSHSLNTRIQENPNFDNLLPSDTKFPPRIQTLLGNPLFFARNITR